MFSRISCLVMCVSLAGFCCMTALDANAATNEEPLSGYVLSIDQGAPGADEIARKDYQAAIKAAQRADRKNNSLSAQHTLCVSYIALGKLDLADAACSRSVTLAHGMITTAQNPHGHKNREGLAKAYSNRSVLRIMQGNREAAAKDLSKAQAQRRDTAIIQRNLESNAGTLQFAGR